MPFTEAGFRLGAMFECKQPEGVYHALRWLRRLGQAHSHANVRHRKAWEAASGVHFRVSDQVLAVAFVRTCSWRSSDHGLTISSWACTMKSAALAAVLADSFERIAEAMVTKTELCAKRGLLWLGLLWLGWLWLEAKTHDPLSEPMTRRRARKPSLCSRTMPATEAGFRLGAMFEYKQLARI